MASQQIAPRFLAWTVTFCGEATIVETIRSRSISDSTSFFACVQSTWADVTDDGTGDELELVQLQSLDEFDSLYFNRFSGRMWVDPNLADDANPGTYEEHLRSFRMIKQLV